MKILILGHGGHGKTDFAKLLEKHHKLSFCDSSMFACERAVFPTLSKKYGYKTVEECHADRRNHRIEWRYLISEFNTPEKSLLCSLLLAQNDVYVGMRCINEFVASYHFFDKIYWVDALSRLGTIDHSLTIAFDPINMHRINNNGSKDFLEHQAARVIV